MTLWTCIKVAFLKLGVQLHFHSQSLFVSKSDSVKLPDIDNLEMVVFLFLNFPFFVAVPHKNIQVRTLKDIHHRQHPYTGTSTLYCNKNIKNNFKNYTKCSKNKNKNKKTCEEVIL